MASPVFSPNTYAGKAMAGYLSTSILGGSTVNRGLITVIPNVKKRHVLRSASMDVIFSDPACSFTGDGENINISEKYLDLVKYEVMQEMCFDTLRTSWEADTLKPGSLNDNEPTRDLSAWWLQKVMEETQALNDRLYWLGKGTTSSFGFTAGYTGLLGLIEAGTDTTKINLSSSLVVSDIVLGATTVVTVSAVTNLNVGDYLYFDGVVGTTEMNGNTYQIIAKNTATDEVTLSVDSTTFTAYTSGGTVQFVNSSNVIDVLTQIYALIPDALRMKSDLKIYVPFHIERAYKIAQAEVANGAGLYFVGDKSLDFLGHVLEPMPYFAPNSILVSRVSNLFLGVDLLDDEQTFRTVDMRATTNDELVRLRGAMKTDVNYYFGAEILYQRPA